jgi:hypothetical protein
MSPNPGRLDGAKPPARPTRDVVPEDGSPMFGHRLAGRLAAVLLAVTLIGACGAGASPTPATTPAPTPSPTANPDEALMADLVAVMSNPYDAAKVAALYAPNAVFRDNIANETSTGLEAIQAKVKEYAALDFKVTNTSAPIRQDNFVAVFSKFGNPGDLSGGLVVYELKDGKVLNQWVYPTP